MRSQNIKNRGSRGLAFMLPLLLLSMASCIKYPATNGEPGTLPDVPKGMVRVGLYTSSGDYQTPVTRTMAKEDLDENSMPWVFVFVGNGDNALFAEVKQATAGATQDAPPSVVLTQQSSAVRVLIVANAPETFFNGTANAAFTGEVLTTALDGKTFGQAVNGILNTAKLTASPTSTSIPYVMPQPQNLPMTGKYDLAAGISTGTSIGTFVNKVELTRVVAKVTVTNSVSPSIFSLDKASVIGAKQFGRLYQTAPVTAMTGNGNINFAADIVSAVSQTTNASPLYIYESAKDETSVIVKGTYNGTPNQYYRLAFKSETAGTVMAVERNKHYEFKIISVTGAGYGTFAEAVAGLPSNNITTKIEVVDLSSHDIIDNGQYYLGVSNSEFIVYADGALTNLPALTVSTNEDTGIQIKVLSTNPTKLTVYKGVETTTDKFRYANITVSLSAVFNTNESVNFTITLGNLQKTIKVTRRAQLGAGASVAEFKNEYAAGEIVSQGDGEDGWLSLSLDGETSAGIEVTRPDVAGNLYLMTTKNTAVSGTSPRKGGEVYLYRHNSSGRVKLYIAQNNLNTGSIVVTPDDGTMNRYVGAFWRWNQTGERVIRMGNQSYAPANGGPWTATVIEGEDWIKLAAGFSASGSIYPLTGDAEDYQVEGDAINVSGNYTSTETPILFRIGLKSEHPAKEDAGTDGTATPRYGLILLEYGTPAKYYKIYVRQGEVADYLMRNGDATGTASPASRTNSKKFSPYNLTAATMTDADHYIQLDQNGGDFTKYPSQAGAFFQFASVNKRYAYHPTFPTGSEGPTVWRSIDTDAWSDDQETCPAGYRRPTTSFSTTAEIVQSLCENLSSTSATNNSIWGYYADGFFDRRTIGIHEANSTSPGAANAAVACNTKDVAYIGRVIYNTNNFASLFLPAPGRRSTEGKLIQTGIIGNYWSSNALGASSWGFSLYVGSSMVAPSDDHYTRMNACVVRCVRQ